MEAPGLTEFWTADEVAECLPVSMETYKALWSKVVPVMEKDMSENARIKEVGHMEYPDQKYDFSLKKYWHLLSEEEQQDVVDAVKKNEMEV